MRIRTGWALASLLVATLVVASTRTIAQVDLPLAKAETVGMSSKRLERISVFVKDYIDTNQIAGAVTLVGFRSAGTRQPPWLKLAALSGFLMTLLFVVLSILPIIQVESRLTFALKISSLVVVTNLIGLAIFHQERRVR